MPGAVRPDVQPTVERDDLDDIFNYDAGIDATFNQPAQNWSAQDDANNNDTNRRQHDVPENIDEEVKVTKKRKPVAKLDEERLLSQQGIPKLRKIAKDRLIIKGKGHEFSDMARLLNTYQLWLDDLFPKAKFMDGVSMIEKLGHKKRMQMMRREWIQEGKPKPPRDDDEDGFVIPTENAVPEDTGASNTEEQPSNVEPRVETQQSEGAQARNNHNPFGEEEPDEDELDELLAESEVASAPAPAASKQPAEDQEPDEDELNALMAEDAMDDSAPKSLFGGPVSSATATKAAPIAHDEFDDDEEAMAGMDW
ncbi:Swi3-domain-containing protein [Aureobasidium namibiae CBS 147.97]|uniref:Chromosome segregation in meiosis protein n=1 Tax=Aureobasidium namibiae CBS 147.97 TaxID=1043004 RepID=A0A074WAE7_9PEZI